jgi:hypothetical protein
MCPIKRSAPRLYELILSLSDVEPVVWRRLRISSGATLARAARVFAVTMGWNPGRPYAFTVGPLRYEGDGRRDARRERDEPANGTRTQDTRLRQVLPDAGSELEFEFGEGHAWHLMVRLDRLLPPNDEVRTPYCVDGSGAPPPLEVGGPWGYEEWRTEATSRSGSHPAIDDGGPAPARVPVPFSCDVVNAELAQI